MRNYTPLETLVNLRKRLWDDIYLAGVAERKFESDSPSSADCREVVKVLRQVANEVEKIVRREEGKEQNQWKLRQAEDLALKAQLAKARNAVASTFLRRRKDQSHK